jgi:glutamine synthetase
MVQEVAQEAEQEAQVDDAPRDEVARAVVARAAEDGLRLVRILYCDNDNVIRGKAVPAPRLASALEHGVGLTVAMQAMTLLDHLAEVPGMGAAGEVRMVPDPATFVVAPYLPATGIMLCDLVEADGRPWAADCRGFLRRMVARAADRGLAVRATFEPEWSLARREGSELVSIDQSLCFSTTGMNAAAEMIDDLVLALDEQGLEVELYQAELGWGQQEVPIRHAPGLEAADRHLLYRETVRAVAATHGLHALFAPKPWPDQAGNGCHIHFSVWDAGDETNLFHDGERPWSLSGLGESFLAGVLDHLPALVALTCASVNSYRRLQPRTWASAYRAWGVQNREAAIRLVPPALCSGPGSINAELKASDSSGNPHLGLGALIAAGLDGVERELRLPPTLDFDPGAAAPDRLRELGIERLPSTLGEALDALVADSLLTVAMGDPLLTSYLAVKRSDIEAFAGEPEAEELRRHADCY